MIYHLPAHLSSQLPAELADAIEKDVNEVVGHLDDVLQAVYRKAHQSLLDDLNRMRKTIECRLMGEIQGVKK